MVLSKRLKKIHGFFETDTKASKRWPVYPESLCEPLDWTSRKIRLDFP
ncbi:hypothetical protein IJ095_00930 [Candidatus Saccharibacteria bacterium]|nr:hypothetical protein [Candidatus Saccharibacteria bacterium]